jgi:hypothetical protein
MKPILFTFAFAATLAAQHFIQMSDPQFGMFTKDASFEHETVNFEFAITTANRLKPAFGADRGPGAGPAHRWKQRNGRNAQPYK